MIKIYAALCVLWLLFMARPKSRVVLVPPGVNVIEDYGRNPPARRGCAQFVGPIVIMTLIGFGIFGVQQVTATPEPAPLPTAAILPTVTITPTGTATAPATITTTPTMTATATATASSTPTITPTYTPSLTPSATLVPYIVGQVVDARELNVRYGPSVDHAAFDRLQQDDQVQLVGRDNGARWGCIYVDGGLGWVSMAYVWTDENIARLPVMEAPPGNRIGQ